MPGPTDPDDNNNDDLTIIIVFSSIGVVALIAAVGGGFYLKWKRDEAIRKAYNGQNINQSLLNN